MSFHKYFREPEFNGHLPALDGVRGIAILSVLIFHATVFTPNNWIDNICHTVGMAGWVGVDLFFVLSGFLITGILYDYKEKRVQGYFKNFYVRRILRIVPLYYLVAIFALHILPAIAPEFNQFIAPKGTGSHWWYWLFLSNFYSSTNGLSHLILGPTWSVAIEEQFYLAWPLIIFFLRRNTVMWLCAVFMIVAFCLRLYLLDAGSHPTTIYVLTPARFDAIAAGAFAALAFRSVGQWRFWLRISVALFVITGLVALYFLVSNLINKAHADMITFGYTLFALFFASGLYLLLSLKSQSYLKVALSSPLLVFPGKLSYGLYLFNRPLVDIIQTKFFHPSELHFLGSSLPGQVVFWIIFLVSSFTLAILSWHLYEKHFLNLKSRFNPRLGN